MLSLVIRKEILKRLYDLRFLLLLGVSLMLAVVSTLASAHEFALRRQSYRRQQHQASEHTNLDHAFVVKPPNPFLFIRDGEPDLPRVVKIEPHILYYVENTDTTERSLLENATSLDWIFIFVYVYSFLALLMTYDAIAGEKERGTLAQMLSHSCPRSTVILGSFIGHVFVLWVPLLMTCLLSLLLIVAEGQIRLTFADGLRIGIVILLSGLFATLMGGLGLLASTLFHRSSTALVVALLLWICMVIVVPGGVRLWVEYAYPIPSLKEVRDQLWQAKRIMFAATGISTEPVWEIISTPGLTEAQRRERLAALQAETYARNERALEQFAVTTGKILAAYYAKLAYQAETARWLSRVSPASAYQYAVEEMLPAGTVRHRQFLAAARHSMDAYTAVAGVLRKRLRAKARVRGGWGTITYEGRTYRLNSISEISYADVPFDRRQLPEFQMPASNVTRSMERVGWNALTLILFGFVLFSLTYVIFLQYDVR